MNLAIVGWAVIILVWTSTAAGTCQHAAEGTSFITAFPQNRKGSATTIDLQLMTRASETVTIIVRSSSASSNPIQKTLEVHPGTATSCDDLAVLVHPSGTLVTDDAVEITSSAPIFVDVMMNGGSNGDFHPLIPDEFLGKEYLAVGYTALDPNYTASFVLVVARYTGTVVSLHLGKLRNGETLEEDGVVYDHRDSLVVQLDAIQTLQVQTTSDLTGSRISSTQPVAVYSGQNRTTIPGSDGSGCFSHLSDQLPPVDNLGRKFVLISSPDQTVGDLYRIVASVPATTVVIESSPSTVIGLLSPGDFYDYDLPSGTHLLAESDKPVMVAHITKSSRTGDPSMGLLTPLEQAENFYVFSYADTGETLNFHFSFAVTSSKREGILLNNVSISALAVTWQTVAGSDMVVGVVSYYVNSMTMTLQHADGDVFAVHLTAKIKCEAMTMPLTYGKPLAPDSAACVSTVSVPGDSLDNDCDGQVDEEDCDEPGGQLTDSDGDGFVGEDCAPRSTAIVWRSQLFRGRPSFRRRAENVQATSVRSRAECIVSCLQRDNCLGVNFLSAVPGALASEHNCEVLTGRGRGTVMDPLWLGFDFL